MVAHQDSARNRVLRANLPAPLLSLTSGDRCRAFLLMIAWEATPRGPMSPLAQVLPPRQQLRLQEHLAVPQVPSPGSEVGTLLLSNFLSRGHMPITMAWNCSHVSEC